MNLRVSAVVLMLFCVAAELHAQAWSGNVAAVKLQITARGDVQGFDIFFGSDVRNPIQLTNCGYLGVGRGTVLFCADDLNRFTGKDKTISAANYFNLRFSAQGRDYYCVATSARSTLFCKVKTTRDKQFSGEEHKLEPLSRF
jgi:hypothetical protein